MTIAEWKAKTKPLFKRIVELDMRAEDNGLTDDERAERDRLEKETIRSLCYDVPSSEFRSLP
jgi:uncharacterized protein YnzC (UPF0291/DUF896 family)